MGVINFTDELKEVDNVDETDLESWEVFAEECDSSEGFVSWYVAARGKDDIGVLTLVVGCPVPDSDASGTVFDCFFHVEELQVVLLICYNNVDVVYTLEAVVGDRKETISIGWEINADDFWALVCDNVKETRVLMGKSVVVLSPNGGCEEDVERGYLGTPLYFKTFFDPFAMLIYHGVDDVDEGFVAVQEAMTTG